MVNTRLFLFCPISPFKHFLSLVFNLKKNPLFIFMRNSEICTCSSCQKRTTRTDPRKKQHEICCKFKLLSERKKKRKKRREKKSFMENGWEEKETLLSCSGQEEQDTDLSGGHSANSSETIMKREITYLYKIRW